MLDYFKEFQVLAVHLNFTTAAREIGVSQSCLSRHIATLEREIGFPLLERNPVRLTAVGKRFLTGVEQSLARIDEIAEECRRLSALGPQHLRIATIIASDVITPAVYRALSVLHDEFPTLTHEFVDNRSLTIRETVEARQADVGVLCHEPRDLDPTLRLELLFENPFGAIMHRDDPLTKGPVHFADLSERSLVFSTSRQFTTWVEGMRVACERYGCAPRFTIKEAEHIEDFLVSLQPGEAIFTQTDTFHPEETNPNLVTVEFADPETLTYPTYLLYPRSSANPVVERFVELMRAEAQRLRDAGIVV
jgi:DNA-binding transcriptional LysR family regulator